MADALCYLSVYEGETGRRKSLVRMLRLQGSQDCRTAKEVARGVITPRFL